MPQKGENCASRPRPNPSETKKRPTSSEATSILASTMRSPYMVCSSHEAVLSTRRNPAHPVSFLIPHPTTTYRLAGDTCVVYYQNVIILYVRVIRVRYDKCYQVYE